MPKAVPPNPFDSHSYSVPRGGSQCSHPSCSLPAEPAGLCELHRGRPKPRKDNTK